MKFLAFAVILLGCLPIFAQSKEYVCLPCGYECDTAEFDKLGTCEHCGMTLVKKSAIKFTTISITEMCNGINANPNVVLLDVRSADEFKGTSTEVPTFGHFKKAININITELESRLGELKAYKSSEIIVYCSHSHRSPRASYLLGQNGFTNVKNMAGGVSTLKDLGNQCLAKHYQAHSH